MSFLNFNVENKKDLDLRSFQLNHNINEDVINLDTAKSLIQDLSVHQISYNSNSVDLLADFEKILRDKTEVFNPDSIQDSLLKSSSYIALSNIQDHPLMKGLCQQIDQEISNVYKQKIKGANYWMFIASPGAVTPFHFDRFSNFIFQIRGTKELAVFPSFEANVLDPRDCEKYCSGIVVKSPWNESIDQYARKYRFKSGQAVHIPFTSAHYVRNDNEDISITISVFYHSKRTLLWSRAMRFNNHFRTLFCKLKLSLKPVLPNKKSNFIKAYFLPLAKFIK